MMKKRLLLCVIPVFLTACEDKKNYEQAVLAQMQTEQDLKDYQIDPAKMADCVVENSAKEMPGLFPFDPDRLIAYQNYTKMLSMSTAKDKQKVFEELRTTFGTPQDFADAHRNYTESIVNCMDVIIQRTEKEEENEK